MKVYSKDEDKDYAGTFMSLSILFIFCLAIGVMSFFILKNIYNSYEEINLVVILSEHIEIYWALFFIGFILFCIIAMFIKPVKVVTLTKKEIETYNDKKIIYLTFETNERHGAMVQQDYLNNLDSYAKESEDYLGVYKCFVYEDYGFEIDKKYKIHLKRVVAIPEYVEEIIEESTKEKKQIGSYLIPLIGVIFISLGILISNVLRDNQVKGNIISLVIFSLGFIYAIYCGLTMVKDNKRAKEIREKFKRGKNEK